MNLKNIMLIILPLSLGDFFITIIGIWKGKVYEVHPVGIWLLSFGNVWAFLIYFSFVIIWCFSLYLIPINMEKMGRKKQGKIFQYIFLVLFIISRVMIISSGVYWIWLV